MRQETDRRLDHTDRERGPTPRGWLLRPPTLVGTVVAPTSPTALGGPASLVPWAMLGEYGRSFVAGATSPAQLRAFHGPAADVEQPIRIYAGLRSAGSPDERAALAVRELERTGAFQREVLAVVTNTGTGWVDPASPSSLEYLHGGDTAMVIPGRRRRGLTGQPVGGSDGVLLTGPTASNPIWDQLTDARQPGSPVWRPVYSDGREVQFANRPADLERPAPAWRPPRVLYARHPSDPVGNATLEALWRRPAWTDSPKGYDVPARDGWFPIVTGLQQVADLIAGFSASSGYGHNYSIDFAVGWAAVVPPEGWTTTDTDRLQRHLPSE